MHFSKVANHIVALDSLHRFGSQAVATTAWAYAKAGESHPELVEIVAGRSVALESLQWFHSQDRATTAYAKAGESHPKLFQTSADHMAALGSVQSFRPQALGNTVWA